MLQKYYDTYKVFPLLLQFLFSATTALSELYVLWAVPLLSLWLGGKAYSSKTQNRAWSIWYLTFTEIILFSQEEMHLWKHCPVILRVDAV